MDADKPKKKKKIGKIKILLKIGKITILRKYKKDYQVGNWKLLKLLTQVKKIKLNSDHLS